MVAWFSCMRGDRSLACPFVLQRSIYHVQQTSQTELEDKEVEQVP